MPKQFTKRQGKPEYFDPWEYCAGVTHPETGETIDSYKQLMKILAHKHIHEEEIWKELGKTPNGWKYTEVTQTAFKCFIESTRGVQISNNFKPMTSPFKVPSISEEDETILASAFFGNCVNSEFDQDEQ